MPNPDPAVRSNLLRARTLRVVSLVGLLLAGCSDGVDDPESVGSVQSESRVSTPAQCDEQVKVTGIGDVPMEAYLANVLACEIPADAPIEAKKAQAIVARTYTYRYLGEHSSICNSQSCQVYKCSHRPGGPNESDYQAVRETSGQVLTSDDNLIYSFFVAGDPKTAGPSCKGTVKTPAAANGFEKFVTYNEGMSGANASPSKQGWATNPDNRGSMSQNGAICLANQGRTAPEILTFYYDNALETQQIPGGDCSGTEPESEPAGPIVANCFGQTDEVCGSDVCAWNGQSYCCRTTGFSGEDCFTDGECASGQVCAWNKTKFVCTQPRCDGTPIADAGVDSATPEASSTATPESPPETSATPEVDLDDTQPESDETHRQGSFDLGRLLSDPLSLIGSCSMSPRPAGTGSAVALLLLLPLALVGRRFASRTPARPRGSKLPRWLVLALLVGLLSCSKTSPERVSQQNCTPVSVDELVRSSTRALSGRTTPNTQGPEVDFLSIQLFPASAAALVPGVHDLSKSPNDNYGTCEFCIRLDEDDKTANRSIYVAAGGMVEVSSVDPATGATSGKLTNVRLVQARIDPATHASEPVEGGKCLTLAHAVWDVPKLEQSACEGLSDCQGCCARQHEQAALVLADVARSCVCDPDACLDDCSSLCGEPAGEATEDCTACARFVLSGYNRCAEQVRTQCAQDASCKPMLDCLVSSGCDHLP